MKGLLIREINKHELPVLEDMLYEAVYQPEGATPFSRDIIRQPAIWVYIDKFGQQAGDYCLVADLNGKIIGAVWVRILAGKIKGYGNIDNETPEFAISLLKEYRNQGLGSLLMKEMISYLKSQGYYKTSLSVNKTNFAVKLYQNLGFKIVKENKDDYLMVLKLS